MRNTSILLLLACLSCLILFSHAQYDENKLQSPTQRDNGFVPAKEAAQPQNKVTPADGSADKPVNPDDNPNPGPDVTNTDPQPQHPSDIILPPPPYNPPEKGPLTSNPNPTDQQLPPKIEQSPTSGGVQIKAGAKYPRGSSNTDNAGSKGNSEATFTNQQGNDPQSRSTPIHMLPQQAQHKPEDRSNSENKEQSSIVAQTDAVERSSDQRSLKKALDALTTPDTHADEDKGHDKHNSPYKRNGIHFGGDSNINREPDPYNGKNNLNRENHRHSTHSHHGRGEGRYEDENNGGNRVNDEKADELRRYRQREAERQEKNAKKHPHNLNHGKANKHPREDSERKEHKHHSGKEVNFDEKAWDSPYDNTYRKNHLNNLDEVPLASEMDLSNDNNRDHAYPDSIANQPTDPALVVNTHNEEQKSYTGMWIALVSIGCICGLIILGTVTLYIIKRCNIVTLPSSLAHPFRSFRVKNNDSIYKPVKSESSGNNYGSLYDSEKELTYDNFVTDTKAINTKTLNDNNYGNSNSNEKAVYHEV
jgi:hypothetical protein